VMEVYDPAANSWTTIAPMKTAVQAAASVALNGELYVIGGMDAANATVATVQVYNPSPTNGKPRRRCRRRRAARAAWWSMASYLMWEATQRSDECIRGD